MAAMPKPDFTGTWKFDPGRSALQIPPPESTTCVIAHHEPRFRLERTHFFGGKSETFAIDLTTDGEAVARDHAGLEIRARLYWEGEALVFDSVLTRGDRQARNVVRYLLTDEGRVFTAEEKFHSEEQNYENVWVFERQGGSGMTAQRIDADPSTRVRRRQLWTYVVMSLAAALTLITVSPVLRVAFGLLDVDSLQGEATMTGILFGPPAFVVLLVALGLSLRGLFRGPARFRLRIAVWWILTAGCVVASIATEKRPGFNPYLGTPHPGLGVSDVLLAVGLVVGAVLPLIWWMRASNAVPRVIRELGQQRSGPVDQNTHSARAPQDR